MPAALLFEVVRRSAPGDAEKAANDLPEAEGIVAPGRRDEQRLRAIARYPHVLNRQAHFVVLCLPVSVTHDHLQGQPFLLR